MVSHYLDESLENFSRCLVVDNGKIIFNNPPDQLKEPENKVIAQLLGLPINKS
jgi:ABC-type sulfate/molybdate transport systems, ATPase component